MEKFLTILDYSCRASLEYFHQRASYNDSHRLVFCLLFSFCSRGQKQLISLFYTTRHMSKVFCFAAVLFFDTVDSRDVL